MSLETAQILPKHKVPTITLTSGATFYASPRQSILDGALQAGVPLPYSCNTGRCSSCRCRVLDGLTEALHSEAGLSTDEKAEGWILSCSRTAKTDLRLEVDDLGGIDLPTVRTLPCRIDSLHKATADVMTVTLRLPPSTQFSYMPGQYINVIGPRGTRRSYSLATGGSRNNILELHLRAVPGGVMSNYWFQYAKLNDLLRITGPHGTFFLRNTTDLDLVFLATGTGIAPVKAMLEAVVSLPQQKRPRSIKLLWGGRKSGDLYWYPDFPELAVNFIPVLSQAGPAWQGARGYVQDAFLLHSPRLSSSDVYACGSEAMVASARSSLTRAGLPPSRFHADAFVSSAAS